MKVYNLLLGLQNHASSYPCPYCESPKNWKSDSALRTFGRIREKARQFHSSEATKKEAKDFFNCVEAPLLNFSDETLVLAKICIPELHLLLLWIEFLTNWARTSAKKECLSGLEKTKSIGQATEAGGLKENPAWKFCQKLRNWRISCQANLSHTQTVSRHSIR